MLYDIANMVQETEHSPASSEWEKQELHGDTPGRDKSPEIDRTDFNNNAVCDADDFEAASETSDTTNSPERPRGMSTPVWIVVSGAVLFSTLLMALDNTVVADLQPQIVGALGEINKFPWINPSFTLGSVGSALFWYDLTLTMQTRHQRTHLAPGESYSTSLTTRSSSSPQWSCSRLVRQSAVLHRTWTLSSLAEFSAA